MAIEQRKINDSVIGVYVSGGGNSVITQAFTTCYRTFHTVVTCNVDETDRWTEWTAEQRAAWEKNPPVPARRDWLTEAVEALASRGAHGDSDSIPMLNESTGYYELNGLKDLSHDDMLEIWKAGPVEVCMQPGRYYGNTLIRTNLMRFRAGSRYYDYKNCFYFCTNIEVVNTPHVSPESGMFYNCQKLRTILPCACYAWQSCDSTTFSGCKSLEDIPEEFSFKGPWDLHWSPNLTAQTLTNLVTSCVQAGTEEKPNTLTLHPDAFARLTDGQKATAAERFISIVTS